MNKLWNQLYSRLMNEQGADGGDGGGGNPLGNAGQADYLNGGNGDLSGNGEGGDGAGAGDGGNPGGDGGDGGESGNPGGDGDDAAGKDGLGVKGLLDDEGDGEGTEKPAPSDSDFQFEMPEGFTLDETVQADIVKIAKEHNVTPEAAKLLVQKHAEIKQQELATARATIEEWRQATLNDPDIGGQYIQQTMKNVKQALSAPGGAEVAEILKQTGLQNHPAFIKFLSGYGKMNRTDSNRGGTPSSVVTDQQKIESFYGTKST